VLVKAGTYNVEFNDQSGELSIMQGKKLVAKTTAHVEKRADKARTTAVRTTAKDGEAELLSIAFAGHDENFVVGSD